MRNYLKISKLRICKDISKSGAYPPWRGTVFASSHLRKIFFPNFFFPPILTEICTSVKCTKSSIEISENSFLRKYRSLKILNVYRYFVDKVNDINENCVSLHRFGITRIDKERIRSGIRYR